MFRKYPYPGWLIACFVLWCACAGRYYYKTERLQPAKMAALLNRDVNKRLNALDAFIGDTQLVNAFFKGTITDRQQQAAIGYPFYMYGYENGKLKFWNNNSVIASKYDSLRGATILRYVSKGVFIRKSVVLSSGPNDRVILALIPLFIKYPIENHYLQSRFVASADIPASAKILPNTNQGFYEYPVNLKNGSTICYVEFDPREDRKWTPDKWFVINFIVACFASLAWMQLMIRFRFRGKRTHNAGYAIIACALAIRLGTYAFGLPFHLGHLPFFRPALYASSKYLTSLGDLFIYITLFIWVIAFYVRHTGQKRSSSITLPAYIRYPAALVILFSFIGFLFFIANLIKGLILDSSISFDVNHFYTINLYTFYGLLAVIAMVCISAVLCHLFNQRLTALTGNKKIKYTLLLTSLAVYIIVCCLKNPLLGCSVGGILLLFIVLLDIPFLSLTTRVNQPQMMVWGLVVCLLCTFIINYYNEEKEKITRRAFVEQRLAPQRDNLIEFTFDQRAKKIELDKLVKEYFYVPSPQNRKVLDQHFENQYFNGYLNRYTVGLYFYGPNQRPLYNKDTISYVNFQNIRSESSITNSAYLFYKESVLDRHFYMSIIPIYSDTINSIIGYVALALNLKKNVTETVYPELLQPQEHQSQKGELEYAYAVYSNNKLTTQTTDYPFPVNLTNDTLQPQEYVYSRAMGMPTLYYKIAEKRVAVVVHRHSEVLEAVTLFSYLFGLEIIMAIAVLLYRLYLSYMTAGSSGWRQYRLTLKRRVHLSMLVVVLVSFAIIGYVTIAYFTNEYRVTNNNKLQAAMFSAKQSVQNYLSIENAFAGEATFDTIARSQSFKTFLNGLSNSQKTDINIYNDEGDLLATSQDEIFDKGLISRKIKPTAYYQLSIAGKSIVIQGEKAGSLSYTSAYLPLRDEKGTTLGYINVPFFTSEKDLDFQISNIVVTLLNLYAFIFLVSSFITVLMTRWMTRTFDIIIRQFDKLNLENNERIEWPYDDEIGKLVVEYNKMAQKVEQNAAKLARSERESAWREMARQVAHEIKNPLTPMKLNIQYLQQAARNNHPNLEGLTERVSVSIIEQIDNLSYIASGFSSFAKLPEAKPETIAISELVLKAAELYTKSPDIELNITGLDTQLTVVTDRSQLLRVLTNLLENARQAIPDTRTGNIHIGITTNGHHVRIAIADNGTGIDEETAQRIFQPYFTTKSSGTGLGLAMTKKIIEFWKGEIGFETVVGEGSTFFITLPLHG